MRLLNLILCLLFCIASASAKDIITKTDGTKLDAKVEEITESVIKYRKASNPTGPIYTIVLESVASIQYENGEVEKFNESSPVQTPPQKTSDQPSDDDLIRMSWEKDMEISSNGVSDAQLLKMANLYTSDEALLVKKAKTYRIIGYVGGGVIFAAGLTIGLSLWNSYSCDMADFGGCIGGIGGGSLVAGAAWCLGFNLKANSLMKQAREMQSYSAAIIENDILKFGDNSLTAGINVMGNRIVNSHSLGLSLGLNF